jgi:predicted TIM-barrel fold metal-dependent hydrolase
MTALDIEENRVRRIDRIPPIIDMDAHVVEPADVWTSRLPARCREAGPRIVLAPAPDSITLDGAFYKEAPGTDGPDVAWWFYEDHRYSIKRPIAASGYPIEEITMRGVTYDEMRPGCYKVADRLADMDINGVEAQLCYPNYPRFAGQIFAWGKDRELSLLCVQAYNDWMVEEWAGESGGRLIPLCMVPLWDVDLAAAEVRRNAARGVRAVAFTEIPAYLGLPSLHSGYWDPFFRACDETSTVVCMHIGSGTKTPQSSPDAPELVSSVVIFGNSAVSLTDFLFSGVLARFPGLKLMYAECQIGWIPYVVQRCDDAWETHRWARKETKLDELPSFYYRRQVFSCFFKDPVGVELIETVGVDNVTFETDYPHQDSTWPGSRQAAADQFGHLRQDVIDKIARNNGIKLLGLNFPLA